MENAEKLAKSQKGCITAPAGCGKTHLISEAVAKYGGTRELVLTHTHAGVDALRSRLSLFGAKRSSFSVQTIAGWALRYALSFPLSSGIHYTLPSNTVEWTGVYEAVAGLLALTPFKKIITASYSGVFIDEYQDCSVSQHRLVLALGKIIPVRILGDPLQGIFDFGDNDPIDWNRDVLANFEHLETPTLPRRWEKKNEPLGAWLTKARVQIENGQPVDLRNSPVIWKQLPDKLNLPQIVSLCLGAARGTKETVVAIHHMPNQCHWIASRLKGVYSCIEPIDSQDLFKFAEDLHGAAGLLRPITIIDFASKCMTSIGTLLKTARNAYARGRIPASRKPEILKVISGLNEVARTADVRAAITSLKQLKELPNAVTYRYELFEEGLRSLEEYDLDRHKTLLEAAIEVRNRTRHSGRRLGKCTVGRTVLVKGLEFDHAIILNGDALRAKDLYVAMTRGTRSLTILSRNSVLRPAN